LLALHATIKPLDEGFPEIGYSDYQAAGPSSID